MEKKNEKEINEIDSCFNTKKGKFLKTYVILGIIFLVFGCLASLFQVYAECKELNLGNFELIFYLGDWFFDLGFACLFLFFVEYTFDNFDYKKLKNLNEKHKKDLIHLDNILGYLSKIILIALAGLLISYLNGPAILVKLSSNILLLITFILIIIVCIKVIYLLTINENK